MKSEKHVGGRYDRPVFQRDLPPWTEPVVFIGSLGLICLYLWLMILYWIE